MDLSVGNQYEVIATKFVPSGVIVTLTDNTTELIHVSQIASTYVKSAQEYVRLGQSYIAVAVAGRSRPAELSLLNLHLKNLQSAQYVPKQVDCKGSSRETAPMSLDDMIAQAESEYQDKLKLRKHKDDRYYNQRRSPRR